MLKKTLLSVFLIGLFLLLSNCVSAINLDIKKQSSDEVMIPSINQPARFDLKVTNNEEGGKFDIENRWGFKLEPSQISMNHGETKNMELKVYPRENLDIRGDYALDIIFRGSGEDQKREIVFDIIELKDAFEVGAGEIYPNSNSIQVYVKNKKNFYFENISAKFESKFFEVSKNLSLGAYEKKGFEVSLSKEKFRELKAGFYTLTGEFNINEVKATTTSNIKFAEKKIINTSRESYGFLIQSEIIEKTNKGNVEEKTETVVKKNLLAIPFTSFSPKADTSHREGFTIFYTWTDSILPGEKLKVVVKTNWLIPFLLIVLIILVAVLFKKYYRKNIELKKKVSFVKVKGGEFALKVTIRVNAKKSLERISIIDKLPPLVKLYEKFSAESPTSVDTKNRRIKWDFDKIESGETRILNYIIYSRLGVLGKFVLPRAEAIYEKEGKIKETSSNRAFFITGQRNKKEE